MTAPHPFIPLYFGEEDQDIWAALCRIEPEQRSALIKELLRQSLVGGKTIGDMADVNAAGRVVQKEQAAGQDPKVCPTAVTGGSDITTMSEENDSEDHPSVSLAAGANIRFDLEDLFVPQIIMVSGQSDDRGHSRGLAGSCLAVDPADPGNETEPVRGDQFSLSDLFLPENGGEEGLTPQVKPPLAPWENLLFNIIGTEDDENVIAAIKQKKSHHL